MVVITPCLFHLILKSNFNTVRVSRQSLALCKELDVVTHLLKRIAGLGNDARLLDKIIHVHGREELCRAVGGKNVVRSGKVVTKRLGSIFA